MFCIKLDNHIVQDNIKMNFESKTHEEHVPMADTAEGNEGLIKLITLKVDNKYTGVAKQIADSIIEEIVPLILDDLNAIKEQINRMMADYNYHQHTTIELNGSTSQTMTRMN